MKMPLPMRSGDDDESSTSAVNSPREIVARDVIRGLYEGRYAPGQRLIESDLTAHYGVSRGPVREALNWLCAQGIVTLTPQCGAQVRRLSRTEAIDTLVLVQALLGLGARLAAERVRTSESARKLKQSLFHLTAFDPSSAGPDHAHARDSFYGTLLEMSGNPELLRVMPRVLVHLIRVQFRQALSEADSSRHDDYRAIGKAVLAGRAQQGEAVAEAHVAKAIAALRRGASIGDTHHAHTLRASGNRIAE